MQSWYPDRLEANISNSLRSLDRSRTGHLESSLFDQFPERDIFGKGSERSIKDFTQDWINQYLSGQPRTERGNWLSDDSGSEAPSYFTAQNQFLDDDWLGLEEEARDEDLLKTPRLADFSGRRKHTGLEGHTSSSQFLKAHRHQRTETLRQEDFWGFAYGKDLQIVNMPGAANAALPSELEVKKADSSTDKPLPPPPSDTADEPSRVSLDSQPAERPADSNNNTAISRSRKKVTWRGRNCFIVLPVEDKRGTEESGHRLLTAADVAQRLKEWEDQGYDTQGFNISTGDDHSMDTTLGSLSRPPFPDPNDVQKEYKSGNYAVGFPDKEEWDAYVNFLQEEKLRALGVDLGDEEPQFSVSPSVSIGLFPGLASSPPVPTASAASNPFAVSHPFSSHIHQSPNLRGAFGSLTSPVSQLGTQAQFVGTDQGLLTNFPVHFQPTPPVQSSLAPQGLLTTSMSVNIASGVPSLSSVLSPVSTLNEQGTHHSELSDRLLATAAPFDHQPFGDIHGDQTGNQPRPVTPIRSRSPHNNIHTSTVEIAHPAPHSHSHNVSETLQKGLDEYNPVDYQLDKTVGREFGALEVARNGFGDSDSLKTKWTAPEDGHLEHQHSLPRHGNANLFYGEADAENNGHEGSDFDTNPSLSGTPQGGIFRNHSIWNGPNPRASGHQPKLSSTNISTSAKDFDAHVAFPASSFPFHNNTFQHQGFQQQAYAGLGFKASIPSADILNTDVPAFAPDGHAPKDVVQNLFKPSPASLNVEAPVFNPGSNIVSASSTREPSSGSKIFGDFSFSQISKPDKKSKAIPIIRPDEKRSDDNTRQTNTTDKSPHATSVDNKHTDKDADISGRHQPLSETHNSRVLKLPRHTSFEGKENIARTEVRDELADAKPIASADDNSAARKGTPDSEASTWPAYSEHGQENKEVIFAPSDQKWEGYAQNLEALSGKRGQVEPKQLLVKMAPLPEPKEKARDPLVEKHIVPPRKDSILMKAARALRLRSSVTELVSSTTNEPRPTPEDPKTAKNGTRPPSEGAVALPEAGPLIEEYRAADLKGKESKPQAEAYPPGHVSDRDAANSPDEAELNDIMDQLNNNSDLGIERLDTPSREEHVVLPTKEATASRQLAPLPARSSAPGHSPEYTSGARALDSTNCDRGIITHASVALHPSNDSTLGNYSPVRHLVSENNHISDWDDMILSGEEKKLANRSRFFDRRVNDVIGSAIEERLLPVERALSAIRQSVASIASGSPKRQTTRGNSVEVEDSDADDEDEEEENLMPNLKSSISKRDRKFDKLKSVVLDALASHGSHQQTWETTAVSEIARLRESFAELQALTMANLSHDPLPNMRATMHEIITSQLGKRHSDADEIGADSLMLQIEGLKNMLRIADARAEEEYKLRRESQDSVAELQRLLRIAESEAARHSEAAESAEARLLQFKAEKFPYFEKLQFRSDTLSQEHEKLKLTIAELSSKNITLEGTLDEYRVTGDSRKRELDATTTENKKLRETIDHLRLRVEDSISIRQNLTDKFDRLQDDMTTAQHDIARDQAAWRRREEEQTARYNELQAAYEREVKLREKIEQDASRFEQQGREAAKLEFIFGQSQQENARLEKLSVRLRAENHDLESKVACLERELCETHKASQVETERVRASLQSDLDTANSQIGIVRVELEARIIRMQAELDSARLDSDATCKRYEMLLEDAKISKASALAAAAGEKEAAIDEQRTLHERILDDLRERHVRALHNSSEDRQRIESHLMDRLGLEDEKIQHLQGRVKHLEEKLEIAQSAARAAAEAAQAKGASPLSQHLVVPSISYSGGSGAPEKISPQALRESILVLQDQLQQREARIEELELEVSSIDKDAPNKLKEKEVEISWLRELLGVRSDDLQDIINTVSQPSFDRNAVRDAAIRLKANLQMQLQERDRALPGQNFPSLRSLSELTVSPRTLPLAAAAAFGSWRKGREQAGANVNEQTPSKIGSASAFLSGLLTPPSSNVRQPPYPGVSVNSGARRPSDSRQLKEYSGPRPLSARQGHSILEPPQTPPLLRQSSYDHDAEPASYEPDVTEDDDGGSTAGGLVAASPRETAEGPFGPRISED